MGVFCTLLLPSLAVFVGTLPLTSSAVSCPNGLPYTTLMAAYDQRCFQFVSVEKFWDDARDHCWRYNGNLVKVDNEKINRFLVNTLNSLTEWKNFGVWIGLQDQDSELQWQWVTNDPYVTVALDYWTNWDKGQPGGVFHKLKNCVRMVRRSNWQWHETPCHESFFRYPFICEYEPEKMIVTPSAKMMQIVFTTNHTRGRNPFESTNQKGQPDPNIPGARRSSPFNRGRQHNADGVKVAEPAASANENAELQTGDETDVRNESFLSAYWRYFLVIGVLCVCLVLAFSFMLAMLLVRLWQARRVDSVQTIESLAKNRIWRAVNTRDTDSTYDSRHGVLLKASWENEYIIDDSRAFYAKGSNGGLLAWQPTTANGMKVVGSTWLAGDSENVRNAERESAELLIGGRGREMFGHDEEHIYESIDEVRRGVDALNVAAADCETLPPDADETEKRV